MSQRRARETPVEDPELIELPPTPVIPARNPDQPQFFDSPYIIRDYAYPFYDPRFRMPEEPPDTSSDDASPEPEEKGIIQSNEDGYTGAPPWLQSTGEAGLLSEEDLTTVSADELHGRAVALFDFKPEHENEFALEEGQVIYISSRHGQGWLVAVDMESGDCGLVPEEYVRLLDEDDEFEIGDRRAVTGESEWVDEPESIHSDLDKLAVKEPTMEPQQTLQGNSDKISAKSAELSEDERARILIAAERDMAIAEYENMEQGGT